MPPWRQEEIRFLVGNNVRKLLALVKTQLGFFSERETGTNDSEASSFVDVVALLMSFAASFLPLLEILASPSSASPWLPATLASISPRVSELLRVFFLLLFESPSLSRVVLGEVAWAAVTQTLAKMVSFLPVEEMVFVWRQIVDRLHQDMARVLADEFGESNPDLPTSLRLNERIWCCLFLLQELSNCLSTQNYSASCFSATYSTPSATHATHATYATQSATHAAHATYATQSTLHANQSAMHATHAPYATQSSSHAIHTSTYAEEISLMLQRLIGSPPSLFYLERRAWLDIIGVVCGRWNEFREKLDL
jgi:hypothetical protein